MRNYFAHCGPFQDMYFEPYFVFGFKQDRVCLDSKISLRLNSTKGGNIDVRQVLYSLSVRSSEMCGKTLCTMYNWYFCWKLLVQFSHFFEQLVTLFVVAAYRLYFFSNLRKFLFIITTQHSPTNCFSRFGTLQTVTNSLSLFSDRYCPLSFLDMLVCAAFEIFLTFCSIL